MSDCDRPLTSGKYTIESASGDHKGWFVTVRDGDVVLDKKTSSIWRLEYFQNTSIALFRGESPEMPEGNFISVGTNRLGLVYHDSTPSMGFHPKSATESANQDTFDVTFDISSVKTYWKAAEDSKVCARPKIWGELPKWKFSKRDE